MFALFRLLIASSLVLVAAAPTSAHPAGVADEDQPIAHEIEAMREFVKRVIAKKDAATLRALHAENFTHTAASGRVEGRDARIAAILDGDADIETAAPHDLQYRVYGDHTIIVSGTSAFAKSSKALPARARRQQSRFRWMVYVKVGRDWKIAASQATGLR